MLNLVAHTGPSHHDPYLAWQQHELNGLASQEVICFKVKKVMHLCESGPQRMAYIKSTGPHQADSTICAVA